jgi:hypothetical protein
VIPPTDDEFECWRIAVADVRHSPVHWIPDPKNLDPAQARARACDGKGFTAPGVLISANRARELKSFPCTNCLREWTTWRNARLGRSERNA